ncbi:cerebrin prohormone-like [Mya arenaria]|uniref:cerebrin prohormone-like n=1 Tax=Mya arenaria TaxID=6604 RepID=UPI0022DEE987|nr:cerebrin prohormone-like [Mya arenaria]
MRSANTATVLVIVTAVVLVAVRGSPTSMDEEDRQEIASLAARIIKLAMSSTNYYTSNKRNAGTVDSLYNLPHLLGVGKR